MFERFKYQPEAVPPGDSPASTSRRRGNDSPDPLDRRTEPAATSSSSGAAIKARQPPAAAAAAPPPASVTGGLALEKLGDAPLRLVFVGHNPSAHAWSTGHFYSNPTNWFWRILKDTGIAPASLCTPAHDGDLPAAAGIGFTDVGSGTPGTASAQFTSQQIFREWRPAFYARLEAQARRASAAAVDGCTCGFCGAPLLVAFTGVRQFVELFPGAAARSGGKRKLDGSVVEQPGGSGGEGVDAPATCSLRLQSQRPSSIAAGWQWVLPEGWPLPLDSTEVRCDARLVGRVRWEALLALSLRSLSAVSSRLPANACPRLPCHTPAPQVWVLTSTSGAAAMTREQRYQPWHQLAERLAGEAWPRRCIRRCQTTGQGQGAIACKGT